MKRRMLNSFSLVGLVLLLIACGAGDDNKSSGAVSEKSAGEDPWELVSTCIQCHGGQLTGGRGPDLTSLTLSKEEIVDVLKNGKGTMPPRTADGYEEEVAEYLLSL